MEIISLTQTQFKIFTKLKNKLKKDTDLLKQYLYSKLREMTEDYEQMLDERNDYKSRLEQKERDHAKFDSKIKALEKIINSNNSHQRTPISHPTPSGGSSSAGSSSTQRQPNNNNNNMLHTPLNQHHLNIVSGSSSNNRVLSNSGGGNEATTPMGAASSSKTNRLLAGNQAQATTPSTGSGFGNKIGSIINSAAFNRYQTPHNQHLQAPSAGNSREGIPVANRRLQRRSKSVETWLDHKPPMTTKTGTKAYYR